jgi:prepilin-type N-terminal cleavage/methylation domain-containing protein/prepilin-type processing-associated H-X9-DG protein
MQNTGQEPQCFSIATETCPFWPVLARFGPAFWACNVANRIVILKLSYQMNARMRLRFVECSCKTPAGFTLVELLVVIGIIGVLAGLLLPVLISSKASTRSARCQSNLRQLGQALRMYLDEDMPWPDHLIRLEANSQKNTSSRDSIWRCPSTRSDDPLRRAFSDYQLNFYGSGDNRKPLGLGFKRKEHEVINGSDMIVMGEMAYVYISGPPTSRLWLDMPFKSGEGYQLRWRHKTRANSLFGDGHVELADRQHLIGQDAAVRRRWNRDNQPHDENWR